MKAAPGKGRGALRRRVRGGIAVPGKEGIESSSWGRVVAPGDGGVSALGKTGALQRRP